MFSFLMEILMTTSGGEMDILSIDLDKINLDDADFYEDDLETIVHVSLLVWSNKFEKRNAFKKDISKKVIPVAWHPTRWWYWCFPEDKKKEIEPTFTNEV